MDENFYKDLQLENEAEARAIALQEPENDLAKHLNKVNKSLPDNYFINSRLRQVGTTTNEEQVW